MNTITCTEKVILYFFFSDLFYPFVSILGCGKAAAVDDIETKVCLYQVIYHSPKKRVPTQLHILYVDKRETSVKTKEHR